MTPLRLLLVEDSADDALLLARELEDSDFAVESLRVETREGLEAALERTWDVALVDYALPGFSGIEALGMLHERDADIPVIVVSGKIDEEAAVEALRAGARDFVTKQRLSRLAPAVARELKDGDERRAQRRMREALHEADEKMRLITSQLPAFVWTTDRELRVTSALGDDITVGSTILELTQSNMAVEVHRHALEGWRGAFDLEWHGRTHRCDVHPFYDVGGNLTGCIAIALDVTDERTATEALRLSEARFRSLIESSLDHVAILDAEGRFLWTSPSFEQTFGYTLEELVGTQGFELVHPDDVARVGEEFFRNIDSEGATAVVEYRFRDKAGNWRTVESIGHNLIADPAVGGVVITSRDVTDRRRLEEQLQHTRRLEAIGQLAGGVAHDFNNVLLVVRGYAALLQEKLADTADAHYAAEIVEAADRAAGLTRQLLAFGRRQALQPAVVDVNECVRSTETLLRRLLPEDVELIVLTHEEPAVVLADVTQIEQVLVNLASNGRDAMLGGGAISIAVDDVEFAEGEVDTQPQLDGGRYIVIRVADTGSGISAEALEHVFEPFFTTKRQGEGTGLGLATVYGIVAQSRGGIGVETEPGSGTVFSVYLPAAEAPAEPGAGQEGDGVHGGNERVLLVEDEEQVRDLVATILVDHGYDVTVASGPSQALAISASRPGGFELVVSDVVMPEMSGYELAHELRRHQPQIRNLFMSGYARGLRTVGGELEAGVLLLQKPFTADELARAARQVLDASIPAAAL